MEEILDSTKVHRVTKLNKKTKAKVKTFKEKKKDGDPEEDIIRNLQERYTDTDSTSITYFSDLPISSKTLKGLKEYHYTKPTEIQKETIRLSLMGKDILGAAQTGSGKTLAFLIPILERLFCIQWTKMDGLGALVITPTRELALQIFEVLGKVGKYHDFSAGLVIGGKDLKFERKRMNQCNIIICTPGRLLQHMDENPLFDCVNMQILVLDEADRCLDMGFKQTMNSIIMNLPLKRQTMLFSATQTKSVKDLIRLSLKDPLYISVHGYSEYTTPKELVQNYVVCELKDKVSIIWSFIKNHLKQKIIIFFASCKQTKYFHEIFSKLRPGISLMALYGTLHQMRRIEIYESFCRKSAAVLFATDIASRGLDFPKVHWVVQADCPEDCATYIHRVGRTARYHQHGESFLLLLPSELTMIDELKEHKIPIEKIEINQLKLNNPSRKMNAFLARNTELKDTAKRAFVAYLKSVFLMKNKRIFNVKVLNTDSFSDSLGLECPPRIRFLQRYYASENKKAALVDNTANSKKCFENIIVDQELNIEDTSQNKKIADYKSEICNFSNVINSGGEFSDNCIEKYNDDFKFVISASGNMNLFSFSRVSHEYNLPTEVDLLQDGIIKNKPITKAALIKKMISKGDLPNKKIIFSDETTNFQLEENDESQICKNDENANADSFIFDKVQTIFKEFDKTDKQEFKEKIKAKHRKQKQKLKAEKNETDDDEVDNFDDDSGEEPDISWLPEPDEIYGTQDVEVETELNMNEKEVRKRKLKSEDTTEKNFSKKRKFGNFCDLLTVNETEELALMLLKNK